MKRTYQPSKLVRKRRPWLPHAHVDRRRPQGARQPPRQGPQAPFRLIGHPPPLRLKRRPQFLRVSAKGRKVAVHGLVLQALARDDEGPARLGFTVTKKVGNAVVRNRTRRRLKEAARLLLQVRPVSGADLVLIGRDTTRGRPFAELMDDMRRALDKAKLP